MRGSRISVVAPVYNEEENVVAFVDCVGAALGPLPYDVEIILVDDGSAEPTARILDELCERRPEVTVVHLSRNFGHQAALTAGLDHAGGDAIIVMDSDLQHPPELLPEMLERWEQGHDVVYTLRTAEKEQGVAKGLTSRTFYKVLNLMSETPVAPGAADFRLMDRRAADAMRGLRERTRFLRGLSSWIGFSQVGVPYQAAPRRLGRSKFGPARMLKLAADGVISMSTIPLRIALFVGFLLTSLSFAYMAWVIFAYFFTNRAIIGWSSVMVSVIFLGGLQLTIIGIVGMYIAKIYEEVKQRPIYIVSRTRGPLGKRAEP